MGRLTPHEQAGLEEIFERILRTAPNDLTDDLPPVAVEMWASQMWSIWGKSELVGMDAIDVFAGGAYHLRRPTGDTRGAHGASRPWIRRACALRPEGQARG
ncbi:MAG: hypothetical protein ACYDA2_05005 [Acidimicrobiales bacterium]